MTPEKEQIDNTSHSKGVAKGEEKIQEEGKEPGRDDGEETGAGRPTGTSTARDSTAINPEDENPIDSESPNLPPA